MPIPTPPPGNPLDVPTPLQLAQRASDALTGKVNDVAKQAVSTITTPVTASVSAALEFVRQSLSAIGWALLGVSLVGAGIALIVSGREAGNALKAVKAVA